MSVSVWLSILTLFTNTVHGYKTLSFAPPDRSGFTFVEYLPHYYFDLKSISIYMPIPVT
ncbi:hypothetical protein KSU1_D0513 [Candidatus Jettenia caeni]|uniref:Uncharacterized protein n=1 Tax=Candidatus Jettenia caeni TaxID=247490 RepID=I3IQ22_9BACT|nr:hypothetical protein KSU1_D0508 [Candidatus Jettenia caeni]GAB63822.1 hypothetical protein KSU1_D0513 [Candidatus Jettenia caeni]